MTDKYVDPTLTTGLNDGTSQANAWQSLEIVLRNTMPAGTLLAGDTVHIRTHDGTNDITEVVTATAWSTAHAGSNENPVIFLADAGVKWPGDSGVYTLDKTGDTAYVTFAVPAIFRGVNKNFALYASNTGTYARAFEIDMVEGSAIRFEDMHFHAYTGTLMSPITLSGDRNKTVFSKCSFNIPYTFNGPDYAPIQVDVNGTSVELFDCVADYTNISAGKAFIEYSSNAGYGSSINCKGVQCINGLTAHGFVLISSNNSTINQSINIYLDSMELGVVQGFIGTFDITLVNNGWGGNKSPFFYNYNINGRTDFELMTGLSLLSWSELEGYPLLNALLPDNAASGYSIKALPGYYTSISNPAPINSVNKYWNGTAGALTITAELLIKDTSLGTNAFDNMLKKECYFEVSYKRASDGKIINEITTKDDTALAASTALWSSMTYGAASYIKHKVELTTSESVQTDSIVSVTLLFARKALAIDDFFFLDPDFTLVAV